MRCYAVGDIHGQLGQLDRALELIEKDGYAGEPIIFVGDYTDRGPDSRGVLDRLITGQAEGRNWVLLKGNHDRMFSWFMEEEPRHDPHLLVNLYWLHPRLGGDTTLASYGVEVNDTRRIFSIHAEARAAVPPAHLEFLDARPLTHQLGNLFFVHAGIRPGRAISDQTENDLLWIRQGFIDDASDHGVMVVHGHTKIDFPTHYGNRINLDGGAGYGNPLVPVVFEDTQAWTLDESGRRPLLP